MRITIDIHEGVQKPHIELSQSQEMPAAIDTGGPPTELLSRLPEETSPKETEGRPEDQPGGSPPAWLLQAIENDRVRESSPLRAIPVEERFASSRERSANSEGLANGGAPPD